MSWNQGQLSCGTGGSFAVEPVAGFPWNRWQLWLGIRTLDNTLDHVSSPGDAIRFAKLLGFRGDTQGDRI